MWYEQGTGGQKIKEREGGKKSEFFAVIKIFSG
jgi:hypothetical protein